MAETRNLKVSVENFGPVKEGEFELKPLTIFIGPNNSGKSYMALLAYTFSKALSFHDRLQSPFFTWGGTRELGHFLDYSQEVEEWVREVLGQKKEEHDDLLFKDLPPNIQQAFQGGFGRIISGLRESLDGAFRQNFGCDDLKDLLPSGDSGKTLTIQLNKGNGHPPLLTLLLEPDETEIQVKWVLPDISSLVVPIADIPIHLPLPRGVRRSREIQREEVKFVINNFLLTRFWSEFLRTNGISSQDTYYFPPARSGILQGWPALTAMAVQMVSRRWPLEQVEVPPLTGVTGDFLQILLNLISPSPFFGRRPNTPKNLRPALALLENRVFQGEVSSEMTEQKQPRILYKSGPMQLPLQRASSMVGELAPLDLWIKHFIDPGDFLIIDEPEAHLHPENQRLIATVLVRLVRAGVRVLCTTHSPTILHQISNHLLASERDPNARKKLGFTEDDLLTGEEVGVYLFDMGKDGTHIKPVPIEPGFGISEEEFVRVAEAIGEETYRLSIL